MRRSYLRLTKIVLCFGVLVVLLLTVSIGARFLNTVSSAYPHEWQRRLSTAITLTLHGVEGDEIVGHPIKAVWAHALKGDCEALKELYLNTHVPEPKRVFYKDRSSYVKPKVSIERKTAKFVRWACIDALAAIGSDEAMGTMIEIFENEPLPDCRLVSKIIDSGNKDAIAVLCELASSGNFYTRDSISWGVFHSDLAKGGSSAVDLLCTAFQSEDGFMWFLAARKLTEIPLSMPDLRASAETCLREFVKAGLSKAGTSKLNRSYRKSLLATFLGRESQEAHAIIQELIADDPKPPEGVGFSLLHLLPEDEAMRHIERLAASADERSRAVAASAASKMPAPRAIPIIEQLSRDESKSVRIAVARDLVTPFDGREEIVLRLARDPEYMVREACLMPLSALRTEDSQDMLIDLQWTESSLNESTSQTWRYCDLSRPGIFTPEYMRSELRELACSRRMRLRRLAASCLGHHTLDGMDDVLPELAQDISLAVRYDALKSLYKVNPDELKQIVSR